MVNEHLQKTAPYSTTEIVLTEVVHLGDVHGLLGNGIVKVNESISFADRMNMDRMILPKILTKSIDLLALNGTYTNSTIALNGTSFVTMEDTILSSINTMSISSWIKPEFNTLSTSEERVIPQYAITTKENSFNLYTKNLAQPARTVGFSVFDGILWHDISGHTVLDENWHHVMASVNGSRIALYVDGNLEGEQTLQNEFSIGKNGQYSITDSKISISNSEIVVGAYVSTVREETKISDKFVGEIASVDVYTDVLNAEQIAYKYETELLEFYKIVSLYETIEIGDQANLLYELTIKNDKSYRMDLHETVDLRDLITVTESDKIVTGSDKIVNLNEMLSIYDNAKALNPFAPSVTPEIQMVKSGFLLRIQNLNSNTIQKMRL